MASVRREQCRAGRRSDLADVAYISARVEERFATANIADSFRVSA